MEDKRYEHICDQSLDNLQQIFCLIFTVDTTFFCYFFPILFTGFFLQKYTHWTSLIAESKATKKNCFLRLLMHKCVSKKLYSLHWMTPIHTLVKFFSLFFFNSRMSYFFLKFFVWRKISKKENTNFWLRWGTIFWKKERSEIKIIRW